MADLNNAPRWFLIWLAGGLLAILTFAGGFSINRAFEESDRVKSVAYQAKNSADDAILGVQQLHNQIAELRGAFEVNRKEYREDTIRQEANARAMEERIIRAVKSV